MKINILSLVKGVSELAVSAGAGAVVGNLVKATTPDELSRLQKIVVGVGAYAVGAVIGDLSAKYISGQIDGYAEKAHQIFHPNENVAAVVDDLKDAVVDTVDAAEAVVTEIKTSKKAPKPSDSE